MREGSSELRGVLTGSFDFHYVADLTYDGERLIKDLPVTDPRFRENADGTVQHSGSCTVVWTDEFATTLSPRDISDPLAPFGAQLAVYVMVTAGPFSERVPYGRFEITDIPSARDEHMRFRGAWVTVGSTVELELKEILDGVGHETFDVPTGPSQLVSAWDEVASLSGLPVSRTVADAAIPRAILYPESKLEAIYDLMRDALGAVPHLTADGVLAARPIEAGAPVDSITRAGSLVDLQASLSSKGIYNRYVVRTRSTGEADAVLAVAEQTDGPLRVRNSDGSVSPFRARTKYLSSELVTTAEQGKSWAAQELQQGTVLRTRMFDVVETFNPLRERGDVVLIEEPTQWLVSRVVDISRTDRPTQVLSVAVESTTPNLTVDAPDWPVPVVGAAYFAADLFAAADLFTV